MTPDSDPLLLAPSGREGVADGPDRVGGPGRRRRWLGWWAAVSVVLVALAFVAGSVLPSPWREARANSEARLSVTAQVVSRTFTAEGARAQGTLSLGASIPVVASAGEGASVVVTGTPAKAGQELSPGDVVIEVNGRPVIFLRMPFPMYRDLRQGDSGDDVAAVQRALTGAGVYSGAVDGVYGPRTSGAVAGLYRAAGASVPVDPDAGAAPGGTSSRGGGSADAGEGDAKTADGAGSAQQPAAAPGSFLPRAEVLAADVSRVSVISTAKVGASPSGESDAVGLLRGGSAAVTARVAVADKGAFAAGARVSVAAVDDASRSVDGRVVSLGEFTAGNDGEVAGFDADVSVGELGDGWSDGDRVVVSLAGEGAASRESTAVPLTAVREDSSGTYVLVKEAGLAPARVPVTVGVSDGGWAEVTQGELRPGQAVVLVAQ